VSFHSSKSFIAFSIGKKRGAGCSHVAVRISDVIISQTPTLSFLPITTIHTSDSRFAQSLLLTSEWHFCCSLDLCYCYPFRTNSSSGQSLIPGFRGSRMRTSRALSQRDGSCGNDTEAEKTSPSTTHIGAWVPSSDWVRKS
jgi:hypothetical protein